MLIKTIFTLTFLFLSTLNSISDETSITASSVQEIKNFESMPEFPGGTGELMKFISKNKHYENGKDKNRGVGVVTVRFVVEKDGSIGDSVKVLQPLSEYYNSEAIRIVKAMPKWTPGMHNGESVRVLFTLPVRF